MDAALDALLAAAFALGKRAASVPTGTDYSVMTLSSRARRHVDGVVQAAAALRDETMGFLEPEARVARSSEGALLVSAEAVSMAEKAMREWKDLGCDRPLQRASKRQRAEPETPVVSKRQKFSACRRVQSAWQPAEYNTRPAFVPRVPFKFNSSIPVDQVLRDAMRNPLSVGPHVLLPHPYGQEISSLPMPDVLLEDDLFPVLPLASVRLVYVDSVEALHEMLSTLKLETIIAVDLEHHSKHSYRGFTCLIQISSASTDYIVDPFRLWDSLHELNQIFTDAAILKVLYGCSNSDVLWLQRDFSVYLVNMFDVQEAVKVLGSPGGISFQNTVSLYLGVNVSKQFQLADWRTRPLPDGLIEYARLDTRLLLPLFARVRREVLRRGQVDGEEAATSYGRNSIRAVFETCRHICLKTYKDKVLDDEQKALRVQEKEGPLDMEGFRILRCLLLWREELAKERDDSPAQLVSDAQLYRLAISKPQSSRELTRLLFPVPRIVVEKAAELVELIASPSLERTKSVVAPPVPVLPTPAAEKALASFVPCDMFERDSYALPLSTSRPLSSCAHISSRILIGRRRRRRVWGSQANRTHEVARRLVTQLGWSV